MIGRIDLLSVPSHDWAAVSIVRTCGLRAGTDLVRCMRRGTGWESRLVGVWVVDVEAVWRERKGGRWTDQW